MRIQYRKGDLLASPIRILLHGCNAQGVMGAGVAKAIRDRYPEAYKGYVKQYKTNGLKLGSIVWADCPDGRLIGNCITQQFYGRENKRYCSYGAIRECMRQANLEGSWEGTLIAMPRIGAGLAGGDWPTIASIIEEEFTDAQPVVYEL